MVRGTPFSFVARAKSKLVWSLKMQSESPGRRKNGLVPNEIALEWSD